MKKLLLFALCAGAAAFAQGSAWAPSASNSTTAAGEINQKMAIQWAAGAPSALNCTVGHDEYLNTTNFDVYKCSVTGTPGTWVKDGSVLIAGTNITLTSGAGGTTISSAGAAGPTGPTGSSGSGAGTIDTGSNPAIAQYVGSSSIIVGPVTVSGDATIASGGALTISANAVTSAKEAVVNTRRVCDIPVGDTSASAIVTAQLGPQSRICYIPAAATIVEMDVNADAGTPNVIVGRNHAGTITNIVSGALATAASGGIACSNTGGTTGINGATTCSGTLQNTSVAAGDYLELVSGTPGGTAKFFAAHIVYTVN